MTDDYEDLKRLRLPPEMMQAITERKVPFDARLIRKKHQRFIKVPWSWVEGLRGASGQTYATAHALLWLHWRQHGGAIKLANCASGMDGIRRQSKQRALSDLERRGLVVVERRQRKSPIVRLNL
jgi:hypothetical protein